MRIDGWIFMIVSWAAILSMFIFTLAKILRVPPQPNGDGGRQKN